ncbi:MAG: hypothetical protein QOE24_1129, partial [Frankiales bacterium]|nr:hypothetical protein [Frankiales bacterium]
MLPPVLASDAVPAPRRRFVPLPAGAKEAALGLLLALASIGFFVGTTLLDNGLLRTGTRVGAQVLRPIAPGGVNPFDSGRIVVRYPTPLGSLTRTIWLDDLTNS